MFKQAPLSSTYMLVSMLGFIFSAFLLEHIPSWSMAFLSVFTVMFIASVVSMGNISFDDLESLEELNIHHPLHYHKKRTKKK